MRRILAALVACVALTGCSAAPTPRGAQPTSTPPAASPGCGTPAPATARLAYAGRWHLLALPDRYDPRRPVPVIVNLHGLRSSALQQSVYSGLPQAAAARGFAVVTAQAAPSRQGWELPGMRGTGRRTPNEHGSADIDFVAGLLDHLEKTLCVDREREYAAGMSNGGGLSAALICGLDGRLAGVAPVAGLSLAPACARPRPTRMIAFHGTADRVVPYAGGPPYLGDLSRVPRWMHPARGAFRLPPVPQATRGWARALGCRAAVNVTRGALTHRRYPDCRDGGTVELYVIAGGGHTWPGPLTRGGAPVDATRVILDAFSR